MNTKTLSQPALDLIEHYKNLHISDKKIQCPYFNNKRSKVRAALRVTVGKGSVCEIEEEATIIALREKVDLATLAEDHIKQFLVDHNIGIDCSGFTYYVLDADLQSRGKKSLKSYLSFPLIKNPIRKLVARMRPVENTGVTTLAHDKNSKVIALPDIQPGDMITMIAGSKVSNPNHVLVVIKVEYDENQQPKTIHYTHSYQWSSDGKYNHGVREGSIHITDRNKPLLGQQWTEQEKTEEENETLKQMKSAERVEIRRLHANT